MMEFVKILRETQIDQSFANMRSHRKLNFDEYPGQSASENRIE